MLLVEKNNIGIYCWDHLKEVTPNMDYYSL